MTRPSGESWDWKPEGRDRFVRALLKAVILVLSVILGVLVATLWASAAEPQTVPVRQIWIIDGDTLDVLVPTKDRIRLEGIDAPESWRPHCEAEKVKGLEAKREAIEIVRAGRVATIVRHGQDIYGRTLGTVAIDGKDLGETMMERGLALAYRPGHAAKANRVSHWCGPGEWLN